MHSSIDGPLSCFHVLTIANDAEVSIGMHVSFRISVFFFFLLGKILRSVIVDSYIFNIFEALPYCFP